MEPGSGLRGSSALLVRVLDAVDGALASIDEGVTIADARLRDAPLVYANAPFHAMTGYAPREVLGRNCRLLQGPDTDPAAVQRIRDALAAGTPCVVELLNYRRDGTTFLNRLSIVPVRDDAGAVAFFVGIQSDVTAWRETERRAEAAEGRALDLEARLVETEARLDEAVAQLEARSLSRGA